MKFGREHSPEGSSSSRHFGSHIRKCVVPAGSLGSRRGRFGTDEYLSTLLLGSPSPSLGLVQGLRELKVSLRTSGRDPDPLRWVFVCIDKSLPMWSFGDSVSSSGHFPSWRECH